MKLTIELDREEDGRWIAEVPELPGVLCYGQTCEGAIGDAERLAMQVIADRVAQDLRSTQFFAIVYRQGLLSLK